jgi:hypothetical protein
LSCGLAKSGARHAGAARTSSARLRLVDQWDLRQCGGDSITGMI